MINPTWSIKADWGRDNTYGHAKADLSGDGRVIHCAWTNGLADAWQEFAPPSRLTMRLRNEDGAFQQDNASAAYYGLLKRGILVRIQATYDSTTYTMYIGRIAKVKIDPSRYPTRTDFNEVTITCEGFMGDLLDAEYAPLLQTDVRVDEAIEDALSSGLIISPYESSYWILGGDDENLGGSLLGVNTRLPDPSQWYDLEEGIETLDFVGDAADSEFGGSAQTFLRGVVGAEMGGRFWEDARVFKFMFHNRRHDLLTDSEITLTEFDITSADVRYGEDVINVATANFTERSTGSAGSVLWELSNARQISAGETVEINARYNDPDVPTARVGGTDMITPVASTDYVANSEEDGSGDDVASDLGVGATFSGTSVRLRLTNDSEDDLYVTTLQVRGTPLSTYDNQFARHSYPGSVQENGYRRQAFSLPYVANAARVESYLRQLVINRGDPATRFASVTIWPHKGNALMEAALDLTVGDRITIEEDWSDHEADYVIVGEKHAVDGKTKILTTTWILKPCASIKGWALGKTGSSELGETTYLVL